MFPGCLKGLRRSRLSKNEEHSVALVRLATPVSLAVIDDKEHSCWGPERCSCLCFGALRSTMAPEGGPGSEHRFSRLRSLQSQMQQMPAGKQAPPEIRSQRRSPKTLRDLPRHASVVKVRNANLHSIHQKEDWNEGYGTFDVPSKLILLLACLHSQGGEMRHGSLW